MSDQRNIIRLADMPRKADPVAKAWDRLLQAADDDAAYDRAKLSIETTPATTLPGVQAKFAVAQAMLTDHFRGVRLTSEGEITVLCLLGGIEESLARIAGRRVPSNWRD